MSKLVLQDVELGYARPLVSDINLRIANQEKIGVVGINGAGKSTLIKCITGELEPTQGSVSIQRGLRIAHVDQHVPKALLGMSFRQCVALALPPGDHIAREWEVDYILDVLHVPTPVRQQHLIDLSAGWQRFALIARAWLGNPDIALLDEPTNFLDLEKVLVLERWIRDNAGDTPMIIVSHDRRFLDNVTDSTLFVRPARSRFFTHPYSRAVDLLEAEDRADDSRRERDTRHLERMRKSAHQLRQIGVNKHSDAALKRSAQLDRKIQTLADAIPRAVHEQPREIQLSNSGTHAKVVVEFQKFTLRTPDNQLLLGIDELRIWQGERVVILGRNGAGKTRLIQAIHAAVMDHEAGAQAGIRIPPSISCGYVDHAMQALDAGSTPLRYISERFRLHENRTTSLLVSTGFELGLHGRPIAQLSAGQRVRLLLLVLRLEQPNFYLLDEPTNHVDIQGQEALEQELVQHQATCIFASHDREFIDQVATRFLWIRGQRLSEVESAEGFYREVREMADG
ncbi:putative ABC transporter ATP-binding protein YbiT [Pseudomonas fluorescens]|uniref:Putative ABC transporter ATP-binding protein YbiT n=1 Tax=Pseudomonas fluorescens TaxID=294 RepID=A0A5E7SR57_PSEFL|nr:ATP-binding cassette domain-containing protein [Pseudomonas fluorescens]VVP88906.1 putative ABC transporter ATP-binding protein YbiT [Pseudomonas fluorescens]